MATGRKPAGGACDKGHDVTAGGRHGKGLRRRAHFRKRARGIERERERERDR